MDRYETEYILQYPRFPEYWTKRLLVAQAYVRSGNCDIQCQVCKAYISEPEEPGRVARTCGACGMHYNDIEIMIALYCTNLEE